jgi:transposase InsO family protein
MKFVARLRSGESMTDLCQEFSISRKTGYKFLKRFEQLGAIGLCDQRRVPERIPHRTKPEVQELVLALRKKHPTWGPKKLRAMLVRQQEGMHFPSVSAMAELLKREGLVKPHRRRRADAAPFPHLSAPTAPNDVWCIDYKGQFRLGCGRYCYPLTLTDAASRYILACEGFDRICGDDVRRVLDVAFRTHGVPAAIRFDGGPPFASTGLRRLSKLSVWWLRLGIRLEQIEPASPQQNGRHERMHRTLKAETTRPAAANLLQQQERFDTFLDHFNRERPHEALDMRRPADVFVRSPRSYASDLPPLDYPVHDLVATVAPAGHVRIPGIGRSSPNYFLAGALAGQRVGLRELDDDQWLVSFLDLDLGIIDERQHLFVPTGQPTADRIPPAL